MVSVSVPAMAVGAKFLAEGTVDRLVDQVVGSRICSLQLLEPTSVFFALAVHRRISCSPC